MGYSFKRGESVRENVRRIAAEQVEAALRDLDDDSMPLDERVHRVRKACKKVRGLLRLVRPALGKSVYARENAAFRDAAALLSDLRDAGAAIATVDKLANRDPERLPPERVVRVHAALREHRDKAMKEAVDQQARLAEFRDAMSAALQRIPSWKLSEKGFAAIRGGLMKTYERGYDDLREARETPHTEVLHDWRKRVKYHWYHIRLLQPMDRKTLKDRRRELKRLGELLGDDHDLAVLAEIISEIPEFECRGTMGPLIRERRKQLQTEAFESGRRLYSEKPKKQEKSHRKRWKKWRGGS